MDWVLVEIRITTDASLANNSTVLSSQAAFVLNNGSIVGLDGSSVLTFPPFTQDSLFAVVWHRNHLNILSSYPIIDTEGVFNYDFSTSAEQAYGTDAQVNLVGGIFGMYAGNADGNSTVHLDDINIRWTSEAGRSGYYGSDMNMDGQVDNVDKNDVWLPNQTLTDQVPD